MSQNDDHIEWRAEDLSRTLDAGKPLYELGSTIGAYKLLSVLGEGGFGMVVYLPALDHPNVSQVLAGRSCFAMEYVKGIRATLDPDAEN